MTMPDWQLERQLWQQGFASVAGVDEAGRGALAGPVVAAVVVLAHQDYPFKDSKKLSSLQRETLAQVIQAEALAFGVGQASSQEIDKLNILQATHLACYRAIARLGTVADAFVTDYLRLVKVPHLAVAKADQQSYQVAAASILAKTHRDQQMIALAENYPGYGFDQHKGYPTLRHKQALAHFGPCQQHRLSFKPVAQQALFL